MPFYKEENRFWSSSDREVRKTSLLGYAYPETKDWDRKSCIEQINSLYKQSSAPTIIQSFQAGDPGPQEMLKEQTKTLKAIKKAKNNVDGFKATAEGVAQLFDPNDDSIEPPPVTINEEKKITNIIDEENKYWEWLVDIKAPKHAFQGDYAVHIFLGHVIDQESPQLYRASPYQIGSFVPLGQGEDTGCTNCQKAQSEGLEITGQVPLTIALIERWFGDNVGSLHPDDVTPFLAKYLH